MDSLLTIDRRPGGLALRNNTHLVAGGTSGVNPENPLGNKFGATTKNRTAVIKNTIRVEFGNTIRTIVAAKIYAIDRTRLDIFFDGAMSDEEKHFDNKGNHPVAVKSAADRDVGIVSVDLIPD